MFQIEEEQQLIGELRRIEARKKERERKTQDLQKLISGGEAVDQSAVSSRKYKQTKKKMTGVNKMVKSDSIVSVIFIYFNPFDQTIVFFTI